MTCMAERKLKSILARNSSPLPLLRGEELGVGVSISGGVNMRKWYEWRWWRLAYAPSQYAYFIRDEKGMWGRAFGDYFWREA